MIERDRPTPERPRISAVVPCYNEAEGLGLFYERLSNACNTSAEGTFEIIFVDDGSSDGTWTKIMELSRRYSCVVGVSLSRNFGHQSALTAGLSFARGDRILVIDADLQDPPELLAEMMRLMDEGADVVYGQRKSREGETWFKRWSAATFYRALEQITDVSVPLDTGDFRLMSRRTMEALQSMPEHHRFIRGLVAWIGFKQVGLPYIRNRRMAGSTKYPLKRMVRFALDALTGFSVLPLRIVSVLGACFGLVGVGSFVYAIVSWLVFNAVPGWASTVVLISILGSIQLLALGIMGEYLGRIYMEVKGRPHFIVREVISNPARSANSSDALDLARVASHPL